MTRFRLRSLLVLVALLAVALAQDGLVPKAPIVIALPSDPVTLAPGASARVELRFRVSPGYHINSNQPHSEFLIPTRLKMSPPTGFTPGVVVYPEGKDLSFTFSPKEKLSVYSGNFTVRAELRALGSAPAGSYRVPGELRYQACNDRACFAPKSIDIAISSHVQ